MLLCYVMLCYVILSYMMFYMYNIYMCVCVYIKVYTGIPICSRLNHRISGVTLVIFHDIADQRPLRLDGIHHHCSQIRAGIELGRCNPQSEEVGSLTMVIMGTMVTMAIMFIIVISYKVIMVLIIMLITVIMFIDNYNYWILYNNGSYTMDIT